MRRRLLLCHVRLRLAVFSRRACCCCRLPLLSPLPSPAAIACCCCRRCRCRLGLLPVAVACRRCPRCCCRCRRCRLREGILSSVFLSVFVLPPSLSFRCPPITSLVRVSRPAQARR